MNIPTIRLKVTMIPFVMASLTGWVSSTEKLNATGRIGKVNNPDKEPLIHNRIKFLLGRVYNKREVEIKVPTRITLRINKNFFVLSSNADAANEPTKPQNIKQTPIILV